MIRSNRPNVSKEFKPEAVHLVLYHHYLVSIAAMLMYVSQSTKNECVRQLKEVRAGKSFKASPTTPGQIKLRELKKQVQRI